VEDGGQEPVGEGEDGAAAGSGGSHPGAVTAACVQVRFALLVVECQQRGDHGVPVAGGVVKDIAVAAGERGHEPPSGGYAAAALTWCAGIALVGYLWSRATFSKRA